MVLFLSLGFISSNFSLWRRSRGCWVHVIDVGLLTILPKDMQVKVSVR